MLLMRRGRVAAKVVRLSAEPESWERASHGAGTEQTAFVDMVEGFKEIAKEQTSLERNVTTKKLILYFLQETERGNAARLQVREPALANC